MRGYLTELTCDNKIKKIFNCSEIYCISVLVIQAIEVFGVGGLGGWGSERHENGFFALLTRNHSIHG